MTTNPRQGGRVNLIQENEILDASQGEGDLSGGGNVSTSRVHDALSDLLRGGWRLAENLSCHIFN